MPTTTQKHIKACSSEGVLIMVYTCHWSPMIGLLSDPLVNVSAMNVSAINDSVINVSVACVETTRHHELTGSSSTASPSDQYQCLRLLSVAIHTPER